MKTLLKEAGLKKIKIFKLPANLHHPIYVAEVSKY